jgi:hypothetical protein
MAWSDILTLIGLILGTVGGIVLTYDLFYRPGANFQATVIKTKLENMRQFRAHIRQSIKSYAQPPYTLAEIQKMLDEEEGQLGPRERDRAKQDAEFLDKYEKSVQKLGAYGVLLIVIGFIFQIFGLLFHAKEEKEKESTPHHERLAPQNVKYADWRAKDLSGPYNKGMAERVGFEPTVEFLLHTLSKRAP